MGEARARGSGRLSFAVVAALGLLVVASVPAASVLATPISQDPYTNTTSQHRTQVEPDSFAWGNTIVGTFQTGRFYDGGASNIGWATSTDSGKHWTTGMLPGITIFEGGTYPRVSDPAVAYDPLHNVWMISTLAVTEPVFGAAVLASRSTDGGLTWQNPVTTFASTGTFLDKNWIACDTWAASPNYGHCYQEWDDSRMTMSRSTDGGLTWEAPKFPTGTPSGVGGQPVTLPNGTVVVPYEGGTGIRSFRSTDGGGTWQASVLVSSVSEHNVAGGLRTSPLPSAEVDGGGKVYVTWQDCSFRSGCSSNDIVMSTSTDSGATWSAKQRIPIDAVTSGADHFIPGIAADPSTSGGTAHLALGYYYYPVAACTSATCRLTVGYVSSTDGGATWSAPRQVTPGMTLNWTANTNQGRMVGDYMSTSITSDGKAHPVFSWAKAPDGGSCYPPGNTACRQRAAAANLPVGGPPSIAKPQIFSPR